ncbi:MAG: InlB B-repeat-containing protein, partial [Anaeroplasmataceae bacterium]|nr:InlB B-repeat-containing protein [Anaeroplasmataceae bacterium]
MKVKKIILVLCMVFSLICVTACGEEPTPKPNPSVQETEYTVSFDTQGGNTIESKKVKKDATIANPGTPTREGYTFGGWYKDAECNTSWDFASDKVTGNITLYAKWTKNDTPTPPTPENKYSVTYVINGHGTQPTNLTDQTKLPDTLPVLTAEDWTFEGWYTDEALTKEAKSGTALTANTTLYAKWTDSSKKNITGVTFQNVTVTYDGSEHSVLVSGSLPAGVKVSYSNNKAVNAGTYNATATLTGDGYNTLKLSASLIINKATFQGLSLPDQTLTFDNEYHTLELKGTLPANSNVTYSCSSSSNGKVKDAGQYQITATVTNPNYVTATYKGTLTISKAEFAENSISFRNERFFYDGTAKAIEIVGQLPAGSSVSYSCVEDSTITNSATEVGKYTIKATISNPNYVTKTLTATLEITASEKERHMISYNGTLYFANALDGDKLYSYANGE